MSKQMGRRKSKSLLKLAYKRVPRKRFVVTRLRTVISDDSVEPDISPKETVTSVEGYYEFNKIISLPSGQTCKMCIDQKGKVFSKPVLQPSLVRMGLMRDKYNHIVPIKKSI